MTRLRDRGIVHPDRFGETGVGRGYTLHYSPPPNGAWTLCRTLPGDHGRSHEEVTSVAHEIFGDRIEMSLDAIEAQIRLLAEIEGWDYER